MYGPRPIRFPAHWCADHSKYRGFLAGGISTASSLLLFFGTRLRRQNFNLAPTQSPSTTTSNFQALGDLLTSLGLQEYSEKSCSPSPVMICLGVQLDTKNFTLSVSSERLCELETLLHRWLTKRTATKSALQSLVGKLVFVSKCVRQSRVYRTNPCSTWQVEA